MKTEAGKPKCRGVNGFFTGGNDGKLPTHRGPKTTKKHNI